MKTTRNGKGGLYSAVLLTLVSAMVFFFGCANGGDHQNQTQERAAQEGDMSDKIWKIEDYTRELGTFEGLDAETEWQILLDRYTLERDDPNYPVTINNLYIVDYYGTHNGYVVVKIKGGIPEFFPRLGPRPYQIDDIVFPWLFPSNPFPRAWNDGKFYHLHGLYDSGLLTRDDLKI